MKIANMLKQAQEMQSKMKTMQAKLATLTVDGESGGGIVTVTMTGTGQLTSLNISDNLINVDEKDMLEDLIIAAVNDGKEKVEALVATETQQIMGGMNLPGGLPF